MAAACAAASLLLGSPSTASPRRAVAKPVVYYLDADGDGRGAGEPILVYPGMAILSRWVKTDGDCNDANRLVRVLRPNLLPDCNANAIAESVISQTICVGDPETFTWTDTTGSHDPLRYRDATGSFWIDAWTARRSPDGSLLLESDCLK